MRLLRAQGIFWRIQLHGLMLLALVGLAFVALGLLMGHRGPARSPERMARYLGERIAEGQQDPQRLDEELQRVREYFGAEITAYDGEGRMIASNVEPPLKPLPPDQASAAAVRAVHLMGGLPRLAVPVPDSGGHGHGGYLVVTGGPRTVPVARMALVLALVLTVLALVSIPLAHRISRPVEEITQAARALGAGDLAARAKVESHGELGELAQAFNEMAGRIQVLLRSERELLANVSHELRTPLARIRMALELAAEGDLERARRYLGEIGTDLGELERLIEDVLAAARLELAPVAGEGFPLHRAPLEPRSLLDEVAARFRAAQPQRELVLEVEGALPVVSADRALLRRVLDNLIDNARKYSDEGQLITVRARAAEDGLEVEVRDRGIGVEPADLPRLFTPFFRTDRSRARGSGGVGLGLTLARRIVEAHGGTIAFESQIGNGSTVRIRLPAHVTS